MVYRSKFTLWDILVKMVIRFILGQLYIQLNAQFVPINIFRQSNQCILAHFLRHLKIYEKWSKFITYLIYWFKWKQLPPIYQHAHACIYLYRFLFLYISTYLTKQIYTHTPTTTVPLAKLWSYLPLELHFPLLYISTYLTKQILCSIHTHLQLQIHIHITLAKLWSYLPLELHFPLLEVHQPFYLKQKNLVKINLHTT